MTRILADLPAHTVGPAFREVPHAYDVLNVPAPDGFALRWLPRGREAAGTRLIPAVLAHLESATAPADAVADDGGPDTVWETPTYSGLGEELVTGDGIAGLYAWIAGESGMVTTIRRCLVNEAGVARGQVAFMGYWRAGVAMRG
jgi:NADPH-dependent ferric siderophore reductase